MAVYGQQFQLLFEHLPHGLLILDTCGVITYANINAGRMLCCDSVALNNQNFADYLDNKDVFIDYLKESLIPGNNPHFQMQSSYSFNNNTGWWKIDLTYVHSTEHSPFVFVVLDDITSTMHGEQKLIQERERALQATRSKSEFLASVSHEIRTPIHTIMGMSELLADTRLDVEQKEYANQIRFAADILLSLVNDVLDLSKIEAGKLSMEMISFDIYQLIEDAADMISLDAHRKGLELLLDIDQKIPVMVHGDPMRIRQIVVNFLSNALKFTPSGMISLSLKIHEETDERLIIQFAVADSGIGIPEAQVAKVFQAFQQVDSSTTRKFGGTGLGLSISQNLVKMMGGTIGVKSREGSGSVFWAEIPLGVKSNEPAILPDKQLSGARILIIDDNKESRSLLQSYLQSWGMDVVGVSDGNAALDLLRDNSNGDKAFDLVLIDLILEGMDGWQIAGEINADTSINSVRLVLMVPNGQLGADARMKRLGWFNDYVTKPVRIRSLYQKLESVLLEPVDLPSVESEEIINDRPGAASPTEEGPLRFSGRVLIAEDHIVNQELFNTILGHVGLEVVAANDGKEAVDLFEAGKFDIVFLDIEMPVMNGYEASKQIRLIDDRIPIIGVTANTMQGVLDNCRSAGMTDYLSKPFKPIDIYPFLRKYLSTSEEAVPFNYEGALQSFLGKEDVLRRVLLSFCKRGIEQLEQMAVYLKEDAIDDARIIAHGMKGGASHLEAERLSRTAALVEQACLERQVGAAQKALRQLSHEFATFSAYVYDFLGATPDQ